MSSHLTRAGKDFKNAGINTEGFNTETVLAKISERHKKFIQEYQESPLTGIDAAKDNLLENLENYPFILKAIRKVTQRRTKPE